MPASGRLAALGTAELRGIAEPRLLPCVALLVVDGEAALLVAAGALDAPPLGVPVMNELPELRPNSEEQPLMTITAPTTATSPPVPRPRPLRRLATMRPLAGCLASA